MGITLNTVIMDKTNNKEMVETIINDNYDYYEKLASDPHKETIQKFNKCLKKNIKILLPKRN